MLSIFDLRFLLRKKIATRLSWLNVKTNCRISTDVRTPRATSSRRKSDVYLFLSSDGFENNLNSLLFLLFCGYVMKCRKWFGKGIDVQRMLKSKEPNSGSQRFYLSSWTPEPSKLTSFGPQKLKKMLLKV